MGVFAYYDADTDGTVYHVIPSPGSECAPSAFYSETDSTASATTIQSDELPGKCNQMIDPSRPSKTTRLMIGYFVLHHGRQQPANDNLLKWFPSDNIRRHILRYLVHRSVFGGDCIGPVKEMLSPTDCRGRQVLEIGTRAGTWTQAMATEFPQVQFRSLDAVPMTAHVPRRNITFEVYDFTEGLDLEDESQDAVFLNFVSEIVRDYRALLREAYRVLRPGGLIYINDFSPHIRDFANIEMPVRRRATQERHLFDLVRERISHMGVDTDTCERLPQWLAPSSDLWCHGQGGFREIESVMRALPLYPHDGFPCMDRVDARMPSYVRHLTALNVRDMAGVVKESGMEDEEAEKWIECTLEELSLHEVCAAVKVYCIYATKN